MPIYDYKCLKCGEAFEVIIASSEEVKCTSCGSTRVERQLSAPGFVGESSSGGNLQCGKTETCCGSMEPCSKPGCHK